MKFPNAVGSENIAGSTFGKYHGKISWQPYSCLHNALQVIYEVQRSIGYKIGVKSGVLYPIPVLISFNSIAQKSVSLLFIASWRI